MTSEFDYIGELEFVFENILGSGSGDQVGSFDEKKLEVEKLVKVYL
jgi:hypothetical protein